MWPPWGENQISPVQPRSSSTRTGSKFKSVAAGRINFIVRPVLQESSTCFGLGRPAKQWFIALHVLFYVGFNRLLLCEKHFLFVDLLQATYSQFSQRNYFQLLSSSQAVPLERPNVIISATFQHPWPRTKTSSSEVWIQCSLVLCANVRATIKVLFWTERLGHRSCCNMTYQEKILFLFFRAQCARHFGLTAECDRSSLGKHWIMAVAELKNKTRETCADRCSLVVVSLLYPNHGAAPCLVQMYGHLPQLSGQDQQRGNESQHEGESGGCGAGVRRLFSDVTVNSSSSSSGDGSKKESKQNAEKPNVQKRHLKRKRALPHAKRKQLTDEAHIRATIGKKCHCKKTCMAQFLSNPAFDELVNFRKVFQEMHKLDQDQVAFRQDSWVLLFDFLSSTNKVIELGENCLH